MKSANQFTQLFIQMGEHNRIYSAVNYFSSLSLNSQEGMLMSVFKKFIAITVVLFFAGTVAVAQKIPQLSEDRQNTDQSMRAVLSNTNVDYLKGLSQQIREREDSIKSLALSMASQKGWAISKTFKNGRMVELMGVTENGLPMYYTTFNTDAAKTTSTDRVQPGGDLDLDLSGDGMIVGEWDGGDVLSTHVEFNNTGTSRVLDMDGTSDLSNHATHVAGTLIGGGANSSALGMAFDAELHAYDWDNDFSEVADAAANGLLVSNHSYGYITGWNYNSTDEQWTWFGDSFVSEEEDYRFGFYSFESFLIDDIAYNAPYYLYVKSAGNDRGDWDGSSTIHPPDGGDEGFDCIGGQGNAKNVLTVGAIQDIPNGYSSVSDVVEASFSSMGPSDDGRIKPDIVGNGTGVFSSLATGDSDYDSYWGTSMAAPNVAGSLILLQEYYEDLYGEYMRSSTLKALVIATADESGPNPGPDYKFGWGVLNTAKAATAITNNNVSTQILEENYSASAQTLTFTASGEEPLTATLVWTDLPGDVPGISLDPTDAALVNNLNLSVASDGSTFLPYKLSASNPSAAATTGVNNVDNVEKVVIQNPTPGQEYTIEVSHAGFIQGGSQTYSLIVTGLNSSSSDLRISNIYGLHQSGQAGGQLSPRYYAQVINSGGVVSEEVMVGLEAGGVNPGFANAELASIFPTDTAYALVSGYHPQNLGMNEITISLPDDDFNNNNSGALTQETTEGTYSYANNEPPNAGAVGFGGGEGALLAKYPVSDTRNLSEVSAYLVSEPGNMIRAVVMDTLGNILAHGDEYIIDFDDLDQWVTLPLTTTTSVTDAVVYAGIELFQAPSEWFPLGLQEEIPAHPDAYYSGAIGGGEPVFGPFRQFDRWMIKLNTCKVLSEEVSLFGPESVCEGESVDYTVEFDDDSDFEWSIPDGWDGEVNGNTITVTPDGNDGEISVFLFNECQTGNPQNISVTVSPVQETSFSVQLCQGESYTFPDGATEENIQGDFSYTSVFESIIGCDSMVVTTVEIYSIEEGGESISICSGESVTFPDGSSEENIESDFSYTSTLESAMGCDSLFVTNVLVYAVEEGVESKSVCAGESITFPDGTVEPNPQTNFSYASIIQSAQGCDSTVVTEVDVVIIDNNTIEQEGNILLAPGNMETYSWLLCTEDGTDELGESEINFAPLMDGSYAVTVVNSFGCANTSPCYAFILNSINDVQGQGPISVFPNPTNGHLTISGSPVKSYELYDISGRLIENGLIASPSNEFELILNEIPAGPYVLRLFHEKGHKNVRIFFE